MFLTEQDIRSFIIGLAAPGFIYLVSRFWKYRTKKSLSRRIKDLSEQGEWLDELAPSVEKTALFCFKMIFFLVLLVFIALLIDPVAAFVTGASSLSIFLKLSVLSMASIFAILALTRLEDIRKYPGSREKLNKKIDALRKRSDKLDS